MALSCIILNSHQDEIEIETEVTSEPTEQNEPNSFNFENLRMLLAFNLTMTQLELLRKILPNNPSVEQCLKKCSPPITARNVKCIFDEVNKKKYANVIIATSCLTVGALSLIILVALCFAEKPKRSSVAPKTTNEVIEMK